MSSPSPCPCSVTAPSVVRLSVCRWHSSSELTLQHIWLQIFLAGFKYFSPPAEPGWQGVGAHLQGVQASGRPVPAPGGLGQALRQPRAVPHQLLHSVIQCLLPSTWCLLIRVLSISMSTDVFKRRLNKGTQREGPKLGLPITISHPLTVGSMSNVHLA